MFHFALSIVSAVFWASATLYLREFAGLDETPLIGWMFMISGVILTHMLFGYLDWRIQKDD